MPSMESKATVTPRGRPAEATGPFVVSQAASASAHSAAATPATRRAAHARTLQLHCIDTPALLFLYARLAGANRNRGNGRKSSLANLRRRAALIGERDRVDMPAVIRLVAMRGAAVTEETVGFCVGAEAEVLEVADAGAFDAVTDIARQIEHGMAGFVRRREEALVTGIGLEKARDEFRADLVIALADRRPERRRDVFARRAQRLHRGNRRLDHAGERAAPAGMRRADDARLGVGEQQGPAVRGRYADGEARSAREN